MARISDLLGSNDLPYPGWNGGNGGPTNGNYQPPAQQGFFNQFFAPTDLPYPVPLGVTTGPILNPLTPTAGGAVAAPGVTPPPAQPNPTPMPPTATPPAASSGAPQSSGPQSGSTSQPAAPSQPVAPVTVIVQACPTPTNSNASSSDGGQGGSSSTGKASSQSGRGTSAMPVRNCSVPPNEQIVTAYATNPRLRARSPRGQELLIEEMTGENVGLRMLSKDSAPVAFVVPEGCDAVDFTFGAIELNPGHGRPGDLDEVITVGALKIDGLDPIQPLAVGDQLSVVVPWRHGSWVELAADRLRLPIIARFYQIENA